MPQRRSGYTRIIGERDKRRVLQDPKELSPNIFARLQGRMYGSWIEDGGRSVGYAEDDLIEQPAYVIESILRDELGLTSNEIDTESFDVVGNTTDGVRDGWKMTAAISEIQDSRAILARILFESHLMLFESADGKYKLIALDTDTGTTHLITADQMAREPLVSLSHHSLINNQFDIKYKYDRGTGSSRYQIFGDETKTNITPTNSFTPSSFTPDEDAGIVKHAGTSGTSLCGVSQTRYKVKNKLTEELIHVRDAATAMLWVKKIIEWSYAPHIMLDVMGWWGDVFSTTTIPLIRYELGDQMKVSHPLLDPGISANHIFMVHEKTTFRNEKMVRLKLIQMR